METLKNQSIYSAISDQERLNFLIKSMEEGIQFEIGKLENGNFYFYPYVAYTEDEGQCIGLIEGETDFREAIDKFIAARKKDKK